MRITSVSRTIFQPFGPASAPVPGRVSRSFAAPDAGTLIMGMAAALIDPDAGTLIGLGGGAIDPDAGTLIGPGAGAIDPDAGTLLTP